MGQTLTREQTQTIIKNGEQRGLNKYDILDSLVKKGFEPEGIDVTKAKESIAVREAAKAPKVEEQPKESFAKDTFEDFKKIGEDILKGSTRSAEKINQASDAERRGEQSPIRTALQTLGFLAGSGANAIGSVFKGAAKMILPQSAENKVREVVENFGETVAKRPEVQNIVKWYANQDEKTKRDIDAAGGVISLVTEFVGARPVKAGFDAAKEGTELAAKRAAEVATEAAKSAARATETPRAIVETVVDTVTGAAKRAKNAAVDAVEEAKRVSALPPAEQKLVRSGIGDDIIEFVKTSSPENVNKYKEITQKAKESSSSLRNTTASKEIVGQEIIDKAVKPVIQKRNDVGAQIGEIVKKLPTEEVDITPQLTEFEEALKKVNVVLGDEGQLIAGKGAVKGDLAAYQNMYDRIKSGTASLKDLHEIRRAIFKEFNLAKARQQTFSEDADRVAEEFRRILSEPISQYDANYMTLSQQYADIMTRLQKFTKLTGYTGDLENISDSALKVSEIASRMLGNASSRPKEVIEALAELADEAGGEATAKEIADLVRFSDLMEDFYGIQQTRSFAGQSARGTKAGIEGATESAAESAANGGIVGLFGKIVKGVLGKTSKEQQKALEDFLDSLIQAQTAK